MTLRINSFLILVSLYFLLGIVLLYLTSGGFTAMLFIFNIFAFFIFVFSLAKGTYLKRIGNPSVTIGRSIIYLGAVLLGAIFLLNRGDGGDFRYGSCFMCGYSNLERLLNTELIYKIPYYEFTPFILEALFVMYVVLTTLTTFKKIR